MFSLLALFFVVFFLAMAFLFRWIMQEARRGPMPVRRIIGTDTETSEELAKPHRILHQNRSQLVRNEQSRTRFDHGLAPLSEQYQEDYIHLMVRNPRSLYAYWEAQIAKNIPGRYALRLFDCSLIDDFDHCPYIEIDWSKMGLTNNWTFNDLNEDCTYCLAYGVVDLEGRFISLLTSQKITTPRSARSTIIDPLWPPIPELENLLYGQGGRIFDQGLSSPALFKAAPDVPEIAAEFFEPSKSSG